MTVMKFGRRGFLGAISLAPIAQLFAFPALAHETAARSATSIGLAAPTAPLGASGSPVYSPNGNAWLRRASGVKLDDLIDDSKPNRLLRADDGWYWGVPIKDIQAIGGNAGAGFDDLSR